jgi:DNA modification methylase
MKPYFEDAGIVIYHGNCLEVLDSYADARVNRQAFDLLLTDPPYGIKEAAGKNASRSKPFGGKANGLTNNGRVVEAVDYGQQEWDDATADEALAFSRNLCRHQIIFGGNFYHLPPSSCWLVWDKDNTGDFADCELAWTNLKKAVRKLTYRWNGMLQQPGRPKEKRVHPTQKPEPVMVWALGHAPQDARTVLDPFMGSGTTLVAAKRLGKAAVGIDINERYCELAAERLRQGALSLEFSA